MSGCVLNYLVGSDHDEMSGRGNPLGIWPGQFRQQWRPTRSGVVGNLASAFGEPGQHEVGATPILQSWRWW